MLKRFLIVCLALLASGSITAAQAQRGAAKGRWIKIATPTVDLGASQATIDLRHVAGTFKAIKLRALRRTIRFNGFTIIFDDGGRQSKLKRFFLRPRERTRKIALDGGERFIDAIELLYRPVRRARGQAQLQIWGLQSATGAKRTRPLPKIAAAPVPLPAAPPAVSETRETTRLPGIIAKLPESARSDREGTAARPAEVAPKIVVPKRPLRGPAVAFGKRQEPPADIGGRRPRVEETDAFAAAEQLTRVPAGDAVPPAPASTTVDSPDTGRREATTDTGGSSGAGSSTAAIAEMVGELPSGGRTSPSKPVPPPPSAFEAPSSGDAAPDTGRPFLLPRGTQSSDMAAPAAPKVPPPAPTPSTEAPASAGPGAGPAASSTYAAGSTMVVPAPVPAFSADAAAGSAITSAATSETAVTPAPPSSQDYDVMPVYYGTDRKTNSSGAKLDYGPERAQRLQLGRALVTIPRSHQMPDVERPWAINIPFWGKVQPFSENPKKHFTIKELRELDQATFLRFVKERLGASRIYKNQALVFIHGFNNGFDDALFRTAQIAFDLQFDSAPFLYSWPSAGSLTSYFYDRASATASRPHLQAFLRLITQKTGAEKVSIIAHSMGSVALLEVLRDLKNAAAGDVKINQIILAAPDLDVDNFKLLAREIKGLSEGVTLYVSSNDRALDVARQFYGGVPRAGDVPPEGPVVVDGIDTIDVSSISTESLSSNHSTYAQTTALMNDIELLLKTGERPPKNRIPILEVVPRMNPDGSPVTFADGSPANYWRYP